MLKTGLATISMAMKNLGLMMQPSLLIVPLQLRISIFQASMIFA
jgi:hypothetical protein